MSVDEDPQSGQPSMSTDDVHIDAVRDLILQNRLLTIREIAEDVGISFGLCQAILSEKHASLRHKICAPCVDRGPESKLC